MAFASSSDSVYVGHLGPIPLYIHWSALILVFMAWNWVGMSANVDVFAAFLFVLLASIILHELGHGYASLLVARNEGERSVTITLWAFGGVCAAQAGDQRALPRLFVVLAGPAVSLGLWLISMAIRMYLSDHHPAWMFDFEAKQFSVIGLIVVLSESLNLALLFFNMLPIYPFDGGQALYNTMKLVVRDFQVARQATMVVSVIVAVAYLLWRTHEAQGQMQWWLAAILAWALWTSWNALGGARR